MCIESRVINMITIDYISSLPRMDDLVECLIGATYFTKINLKSGYQKIKIRDGDGWKTTFEIKEELYEWLVMSFGITNALTMFMRLMNE